MARYIISVSKKRHKRRMYVYWLDEFGKIHAFSIPPWQAVYYALQIKRVRFK